MLSCFLNDAASGCLHWPKCANNFYDYDCDYHAAASYAILYPLPFLFEFAFACIFITAPLGRCMCPPHAPPHPHPHLHPHPADTRRYIHGDHVHDWLAASYMSTSPLPEWLDGQLSFPTRSRIQITIIVLKLVNIWAPKCSNKGLLFYFIFFFACPFCLRFSPLLAIKYI